MASPHQDISSTGSRRYTIPQLLQLAQKAQPPFDLSKFTYDAARAGVVPPLGDCAMCLRRTSGNRPRGWSTETASTNEDVVVSQGNTIHLQHPERQPQGPPGENRTQKDDGFARFLKKHSSPTHNRVTAGGRIVPMEKKDSPPKFALPQQDNITSLFPEPTRQGAVDPQKSTDTVTSNGTSFVALDACRVVSASTIRNGLTEGTPNNDLAAASVVSVDNAGEANSRLQASFQQPESYPAIVPPTYNSLQVGQFNGGCTFFAPHSPFSPYSAFMQLPQMTWPYTTMPSGHLIHQSATAQFDVESQPLNTAQECQYQAQALYERLEQQLKLIDRHRATHSHDTNLAAQRLAIAQRRDEARTLIKSLGKHLEMEQSLANLHGSYVLSPQMNVQAPVYVPSPPTSDQPALVSPPAAMKAPVSAQRTDKPNSSAVKRKPIPIVAPPEYSCLRRHSPGKPQDLAAQSTNIHQLCPEKEVDEWTNYEALSPVAHGDESNDFPGKSRHEATEPQAVRTPLRDSNQEDHKENGSTRRSPSELGGVIQQEEDDLNKGREADSGWINVNPGPVPPHIEELYDIHLDALRLPEGVITSVEISDGHWMDIMGVSLQRPPGAIMTDFEEKYWRRKPTFTRDMLDRLERIAKIKDVEKVDDEWLMGKSKASDSVFNKENMVESTVPIQDKVERYIHDQNDYHQNALRELSLQQTETKVASNTASMEYSKPATPSQEFSSSVNTSLVENLSIDQMSNKGYSLVSVQPVHATVRMPPSFDGATDGNQRNAKSLLAAASKNRSPRLMQRSTPTGRAWYGPHCREVRHQGRSEGNY